MKQIAAAVFLVAISSPALAQDPVAVATVADSLEQSVHKDTQTALALLDAGDYGGATLHLRTASDNANRLSLRAISQRIASRTPSFQGDDVGFALAQSSTIKFEDLLEERETVERRFKDDKGRVVTVRVFGEERDLEDFEFIAADDKMLKKDNLELAEMRGEQAIKRRMDDGALSVLMMSKDDHALIEVEGEDEETVMAFIEDAEASETN